MAEPDPPGGLRDAVGEQRLQPRARAAAADITLGECRHVQQPDMLAQVAAFLADEGKIVGAAERVFFHHAPVGERRGGVVAKQHIAAADFARRQLIVRRRKPVGALPAIDPPEDRAQRLHSLIAGGGFQRRCRGAFFVGEVVGEHIAIRFFVFLAQVAARGVGTKAARVDSHHVHRRLAVNHPLRQLPAGPAGRGDAETMAIV